MKKRFESFHSRLFLFFTISVVIPVISISLVLSLFLNIQIHKENLHNANNTVLAVGQNIQIQLDELDEILHVPYLYSEILSTMRYMKNGFFLDTPGHINIVDSENLYSVTFSKIILTSAQHIKQVAFYPIVEGNESYYTVMREKAIIQIEKDATYTSANWFIQAQSTTERVLLYTKEDPLLNGKPSISVVQTIRDLDTKKGVGVLKIDVSSQNIMDSLASVSLKKDSQLMLADQNGKPLIHFGNLPQEELAHMSIDENQTKKFFVAKTSLAKTDWSLIYLTSKNSAYMVQLAIFFIALALSALVVLAAAFIFSRESKKTATTVNTILAALKKIQSGDFYAKAEVASSEELNQIAFAVNKMGGKIKHHIEQEYQAVINQQTAEYNALQTQINPHFLYNILSDFIGLNRMGEHKKLEESILGLTHLFRYTCTPSNSASVAEELGFCKEFLALHKLQMQERLEFSIDIEDASREIIIPKLLIQPLVENSIQHGGKSSKNTISIVVRASINNDSALQIMVKDNGLGFDTDILGNKNKNVGFNNVKSRLQIYSKDATFKIESSVGQGTCCTITIPENGERNFLNENFNSR